MGLLGYVDGPWGPRGVIAHYGDGHSVDFELIVPPLEYMHVLQYLGEYDADGGLNMTFFDGPDRPAATQPDAFDPTDIDESGSADAIVASPSGGTDAILAAPSGGLMIVPVAENLMYANSWLPNDACEREGTDHEIE
jgi:hypothetical protein